MGTLHFAHPLPAAKAFCGREAELGELRRARQEGGVVCLEGIGGIGKTAMLAAFVASLGDATPDGLVWSFYVQADADAFLGALTAFVKPEAGRTVLAALDERSDFFLILDGFERMQAAEPPHGIEAPALRLFLERFARLGAGRTCLCASRLPLQLDVPVAALPVRGLRDDASVALLRARGLPGADETLREVSRQYAGHPLTLTLVAGAVGRFLEGDVGRHGDVRPEGAVPTPWMGEAEAALTRVLGFYRERLSPQAAALLGRLSLFHGPADEETLEAVFLRGEQAVGGDVAGLTAAALREHLEDLDALGLVEHVDAQRWVAHAVVRDFFPATISDVKRVHIAVARFLGVQPRAAEWRPGLLERDKLEEAVHQAIRAEALGLAADLFLDGLGGADWLCDCGEAARGERLARALLAVTSGPHQRLYQDLAQFLDYQGHPHEAALWLWKAYRAAVRHSRWGDACSVLLLIVDNAVLRGRLQLAGKVAGRADQLAHTRFRMYPTSVFQDFVSFLCTGTGAAEGAWRARAHDGVEVARAVEVLLRMGLFDAAHGLAHPGHLGVRASASALGQRLSLLRLIAHFERRSKQGFASSQLAWRILKGTELQRIVDACRLSGRTPLLADALSFRARLRRLCGDTSGALNDLEEAEDVCRRGGLLLHLVHVLLESRHFYGETPVREAAEIAGRAEVDYGWGSRQAGAWLTLHEEGVEERVLELMVASTMGRSRLIAQMGTLVEVVTADTAAEERAEILESSAHGTRPLDVDIRIPGPDGIALVAPVEAGLAAALRALMDLDDHTLQRRYSQLWDDYYNSHTCDPEALAPIYHLGVLLRLEDRALHAAAVADDLRTRRVPFPGAGILAAASARTPAAALDVLLQVQQTERDAPPLVLHAFFHDLGLLHEHLGHVDDARRAYERALKADWTSRDTRHRLSELDADEDREKCRRVLRHALSAAQTWRGTVGQFPAALSDLSRGLLRVTPACPTTRRDYLYRLAASAERILIACPEHRLRLDSTRGDLTPRRPAGEPDAPTRRLFDRVRDVPDHTHLLVVSTRALKIVE